MENLLPTPLNAIDGKLDQLLLPFCEPSPHSRAMFDRPMQLSIRPRQRRCRRRGRSALQMRLELRRGYSAVDKSSDLLPSSNKWSGSEDIMGRRIQVAGLEHFSQAIRERMVHEVVVLTPPLPPSGLGVAQGIRCCLAKAPLCLFGQGRDVVGEGHALARATWDTWRCQLCRALLAVATHLGLLKSNIM